MAYRPKNILVYALLGYLCLAAVPASAFFRPRPMLRFGQNGQFKILQVSDMHYRSGADTPCKDVPASEEPFCSDLNTTAFLTRAIADEKPDLIVFSGDMLDGVSGLDGGCLKGAAKSLEAALAPAIKSRTPWVAVLGNHDQESDMTREQLMKHLVRLPYSLSQVNPVEAWHYIDGFGNYNLEVAGPFGSPFYFKSVLNLYLLDSGDYIKLPGFDGLPYDYDYIKTSQQVWFERTSTRLENVYKNIPNPQKDAAPGLAYFHIPLPEYEFLNASNIEAGERGEVTGASVVNSGFFTKLLERGDVKGVFVGHSHLNDFCGKVNGLNLCFAGGFGYHAYGKAGWPRRARVVVAQLEKTKYGHWGAVESIKTWKRLDDHHHSVIDIQDLWSKNAIKQPIASWDVCKDLHH